LFCFERIHYTVGFMSWYDTHPNTKINYVLAPMTLAFGPLLFLYVRSLTVAKFQMLRRHLWHFMPFAVYILYRLFLYVYDMSQEGFSATQNGVLMSKVEIFIVTPLFILLSSFHLILYLAFTIQQYWFYRRRIKQYYSNLYKFELNWIRNFLIIYGLLFLYDVCQNIIDGFISEMHWSQKWWFHALSSGIIIYFGIKAYFTKTDRLQDLEFSNVPLVMDSKPAASGDRFSDEKIKLVQLMRDEKPYLDPALTLSALGKRSGYSNAQLSEIINEAFQVNFNDFVNQYRVEEVKKALQERRNEQLSLVGIAYDSGFNSKATFNRVFKKLAGLSPTEYIKNHVN